MSRYLLLFLLFFQAIPAFSMDNQDKVEKEAANISKFIENLKMDEESCARSELLAKISGTICIGFSDQRSQKYPFKTSGGLLLFIPENIVKKAKTLDRLVQDRSKEERQEWLELYKEEKSTVPILDCDSVTLRNIFSYVAGYREEIPSEKLEKYLEVADYLDIKGEKLWRIAKDYLEKLPLHKQNNQYAEIARKFLPCLLDLKTFGVGIASHGGINLNFEDRNLYMLRGLDKIATFLLKKNYETTAVEEISFMNNNIMEIDQKLFDLFPNLKTLNLSHNKIIRVCKDDLCKVPAGCTILLNNNIIQEIDLDAFKNLLNVKIDLSHNSLNTEDIVRLQKLFSLSRYQRFINLCCNWPVETAGCSTFLGTSIFTYKVFSSLADVHFSQFSSLIEKRGEFSQEEFKEKMIKIERDHKIRGIRGFAVTSAITILIYLYLCKKMMQVGTPYSEKNIIIVKKGNENQN